MFNNNDAVFEMFNKSCMDSEQEFDKCFIDADSIIFRIAVTTDSVTQAKSYFDKALAAIMRDTGSIKGYVAVKGKGNFRYGIAEDYKGNRSKTPMDPKVKERREAVTEYAWETGCFKSDNCEADDVVSIWAQEAYEAGDHYVIAHIDKDIDMVPGWHYNFNKKETYFIDETQGHYKMCIQMLTGDSTDNIHGLKGIGPKKAEKILEGVPLEGMLEAVADTWRSRYPREWQEKLETCWNLLYMRRDWDGFKRLTIKEVFTDD
jgi:5'-3' exonuclease